VPDLDKDAIYKSLRNLNDAMEEKIDIRPVARSIIKGFAEPNESGLDGLGKEVVCLYEKLATDANRVRLMVEILRLVNNCSEAEEDDLPDDPMLLARMAETALKNNG